MALVAAAEHPLGSLEVASLSELQRHLELTVHDSRESRRFEDAHFFGGGSVFWLSDFYTKRQALLMGLGYGWMPEYLIAEDLSDDRLRVVPYTGGGRYRFIPRLVHLASMALVWLGFTYPMLRGWVFAKA